MIAFIPSAKGQQTPAARGMTERAGPGWDAPCLVPATFLYEPNPPAVLADVIPYFWRGEFHILYLQANGAGFNWAQLITRDFVRAEYTGIAIASGTASDARDRDIFTGSVIEKDGVFYAFYTGHNGVFGNEHKPDQVIMRAMSSDGIHWIKDRDFAWSPEGDARYRWPGSCRDPYLYWNPDRQEYGMNFTATPARFPVGGVGYAGSPDLDHWKLGNPLPASGRFPGYECSDLFQMGKYWYLAFSTYAENPGWATRYMMAPTIDGPWKSPLDDFFDGGSLYAAKTVSDGKRRFLCGTLARRNSARDDADNGWAGRLLIYELVQRVDGTLGARIPTEVEKSFGASEAVKLTVGQGWRTTGRGVESTMGRAMLQFGKLPRRCLLTMQLIIPPTGRAGIWIGGKPGADGAYRFSVDVSTQGLVFDHWKLPLGMNQEKERNYRPIEANPGDRMSLKVVLDGDAAVACVNDSTCLSTRIYDRQDDFAGLWADTDGAGFQNVSVRTPAESNQAK